MVEWLSKEEKIMKKWKKKTAEHFNCRFYVCFLFCVSRYSLGVTQEEMKQELHDYLPSLEQWAKEYLSTTTPRAITLKRYIHTHARTHTAHTVLQLC